MAFFKRLTSAVQRLFKRKKPYEPTAIAILPPSGDFDDPPHEGWQKQESDLAARMYRNDMQLLFNFGAGSAIRGFKSTFASFGQQKQNSRSNLNKAVGGAAQLILQPIGQEILNLLTLAVQGHFEKAFRRWLRNSRDFADSTDLTDDDIVKALWVNPKKPKRDLGEIMKSLRGVHLNDVPEGPLLLELALVGNVVRHGDGPSALAALERFPELFDPVIEDDGVPLHAEDEELPERLRITEKRLALYAQAVYQFWHRIQFAYTEEH